mmetsp:Transcript_3227/g.6127  ORF Transcript_3227/g.6127 Transcript_3227/m.6127 type:complete len:292 (+) Transcript_3227:84-959(+)
MAVASMLLESSPIIKLYRAVFLYSSPKDPVPLAYAQVLFSIAFLTAFRYFWMYCVLTPNGWDASAPVPLAKTRESIGGLVACTHSSLLLMPLLGLLLSHPTKKPSASMSSSPPFWNYHSSTLISFTTGYMLQDAFWILRYSFTPSGFSVSANDTTFLLHHLATTLYMVSSRVRGAGHYSAMILMWLGEVTNPVHNIYLILEHAVAKYPGERVDLAFWYASKAFAVSYGFLRIVVGPVAGIWIAYDLLLTSEGRKRVGLTLGVVWTVLIEEVLRGSFVYALEVAAVAWSQAD